MIPSRSIDIATVRDLMKTVKHAMLTTRGPEGALRSHPLATVETSFDGVAWFLVTADSALAADVHREPEVGLTYADPHEGTYIAVSGTASVTHDPAIARILWDRWADAFFATDPGDPRIAVLRVQVRSAELWTLRGEAESADDLEDAPHAHTNQSGGYAKTELL